MRRYPCAARALSASDKARYGAHEKVEDSDKLRLSLLGECPESVVIDGHKEREGAEETNVYCLNSQLSSYCSTVGVGILYFSS